VTDDDDPPDGRAPSWLYDNDDYGNDPIFEDEPGAILAVVGECPGCGAAVLTAFGEGLTGCADHTPGHRRE